VAVREYGSSSSVVVDVIEFACPNDTGLSSAQGFRCLAVLLVEITQLATLLSGEVVEGGECHGARFFQFIFDGSRERSQQGYVPVIQ